MEVSEKKILTSHQLEALDYSKHISLTANAGSGKTFVLTERFIQILLNENISLKEIVAVTFTDKASGELYNKIAKAIEKAVNYTKDITQKRKLENIRRELVSANISTIHSFCINLLKEFPVEAEIDAKFNVIAEDTSKEYILWAIDEVISKAYKDENKIENLKYLIRIFSGKKQLIQQIQYLIANRKKVYLASEKVYSKSETEIKEYFDNIFDELFLKLFENGIKQIFEQIENINNKIKLSSKKPSDFETALRLVDEFNKLKKDKNYIDNLIKILEEVRQNLLTKNFTLSIKTYINPVKNEVDYEKEIIEQFFTYYPEFTTGKNTHLELAKFGKILIEFYNDSILLYEKKKKEESLLDFEDILILTQKLLANSVVKNSISERYKYLMIDEYQDTNEIQYRIFLPLLDDLKKGNLFVVGDEKQSIYAFRDAELEVFEQTKTDISNKKGKTVQLPDSFRMLPEIAFFSNYLFRNLFANHNILFNEVENNEIIVGRDSTEKGKVEILFSAKDENKNIIINEAELLARRIIQLINNSNGKISWKDIAVLCRKRNPFADLEKYFFKYKIPFTIIGGKGFYQRQIIYDIKNYFAFLLNNEDDVSFIGLLRSPFFMISDSEILKIKNEIGLTFWQKFNNYVINNKKYQWVINILQENIQIAKEIEISFLLRKILNENGYLAIVSESKNGEQDLSNIQKLIDITISFERNNFVTLFDYVEFLNESINDNFDESNAQLSDENNSVKIMTVHQSKGLEFPVVVLFNTASKSVEDDIKSKTIFIDKNFGILAKLPINNKFAEDYKFSPIVDLFYYILKRKNTAEIKRIFYVAATRAMNHLIITATQGPNNKNSFFSLLKEGLQLEELSGDINIKGELTFLKKKNDEYYNTKSEIELNILFITEIEEQKIVNEEKVKKDFIFNYNKIEDTTQYEIISATKTAVFFQCPVKYEMTYEFGYNKLYRNYIEKTFNNYEYNIKEDYEEATESNLNLAAVKGTVIHKILSLQNYDLDLLLNVEVNKNVPYEITDKDKSELIFSIKTDLQNFFNSKRFEKISSYKNYKNEFEVYTKENDFILYGIIDKLIINDESIVIIDYKTDDISEKETEERKNNYKTQLIFYAFILKKLFPQIKNFQTELIFIKHPEIVLYESISEKDLENFGQQLNQMIKNIRNQNFNKNLAHCQHCIFSDKNNNCVKK